MKLEFLCEYEAELRPEPTVVGKGPLGTRQVFDVTGGTCEGPRIRGRLLPSGGDWLLADERGVIRLDVRATIATDDGALVYFQYFGILRSLTPDQPPGVIRPTAYGDQYFMTTPRFETGDTRYAWLNELVCVAEGRLTEKGVAYRVCAVVND